MSLLRDDTKGRGVNYSPDQLCQQNMLIASNCPFGGAQVLITGALGDAVWKQLLCCSILAAFIHFQKVSQMFWCVLGIFSLQIVVSRLIKYKLMLILHNGHHERWGNYWDNKRFVYTVHWCEQPHSARRVFSSEHRKTFRITLVQPLWLSAVQDSVR